MVAQSRLSLMASRCGVPYDHRHSPRSVRFRTYAAASTAIVSGGARVIRLSGAIDPNRGDRSERAGGSRFEHHDRIRSALRGRTKSFASSVHGYAVARNRCRRGLDYRDPGYFGGLCGVWRSVEHGRKPTGLRIMRRVPHADRRRCRTASAASRHARNATHEGRG
jgi:hypothetical protein